MTPEIGQVRGQTVNHERIGRLMRGHGTQSHLPASTTQVLSSGVAGAMAANRSGLQMPTIRSLAMAWVLTLPAAILLAGSLYWLLVHPF